MTMTGRDVGGGHGGFRALFREGTVAGLTDAQLLERYVARQDPASFEALVARYGPMVMGACRRQLRDAHAAEDAFQATFLVLVRKAASIRVGRSLGPWLHAVALKVAARLRADLARRSAREGPGDVLALAVARPEAEAEIGRRELNEILDIEVGRLPEKYRVPVVLCHLEGLTHEEAAQRLGCPKGTVSIRLMRAHARLRDRLARRGAAPSAIALMGDALRPTAVPPGLLRETTRAAIGPSTGATTASLLANGVLHMMIRSQLRTLALALASLVAAASTAAWSLAPPPSPRRAHAPAPAPAPPDEPEKRGKLVQGRVVDDQGKPIPGAEVYQPYGRGPDEVLQFKADAEGRFTIPIRAEWLEQTSDTNWHLGTAWAIAPGRSLGLANTYKAIWKDDPLGLTITLGPATDTSFVIQDVDGKPVAGATVRPHYIKTQPSAMDAPPGRMLPAVSGSTDDQGRARLPGVARNGLVAIQVTTGATGQVVFWVGSGPDAAAERTFRFPPTGRVEGRIIADRPERARGVILDFTTDPVNLGPDELNHEGHAQAVTDDQGRFVVPAIAEGDLTIASRFAPVDPCRIRWPEGLAVTKGELTRVDLPMEATVKAHGLLIDRGTNRPLPQGILFVSTGNQRRQPEKAVTRPDGSFEVPLLPGPVKLHVYQAPAGYSHYNLNPAWSNPVVVPANIPDFHLPPVELARNGPPVPGKLVDALDRPVVGAQIIAGDGIRSYAHPITESGGTFELEYPEGIEITQYQAKKQAGEVVTLEVVTKSPLLLKAKDWR